MIALGCAGPVQHGTVGATTSIQAAENAGAANDPRAAVYLKYARNDLATAQRVGFDTDVGGRALERSQVNAELALAMARHAQISADVTYQQCKLNQEASR